MTNNQCKNIFYEKGVAKRVILIYIDILEDGRVLGDERIIYKRNNQSIFIPLKGGKGLKLQPLLDDSKTENRVIV